MIITNKTLKEYFDDVIEKCAAEVGLKSKVVIDYYSKLLLEGKKSNLFYVFYNSSISNVYLYACEENDVDEIKVIGDSCTCLSSYYITKAGKFYSLYRDIGYSCYNYLSNNKLVKNNKVYLDIVNNYPKVLNMLTLIGVDNNKDDEIKYMLSVYELSKNIYIEKRLKKNNLLIFKK